MHRVTAHIQRHEWTVSFSELEGHRSLSVGPWLVLSGEEALLGFLTRGGAAPGAVSGYDQSMKKWGVGTVELQLTDEQYIALLEAGCRDKQTAYGKIRTAGGKSMSSQSQSK